MTYSGRLIQKKVVHVMSGKKYNSNTEPIFKYYKTLKIEVIYKINALPSYFQDFCLDRGSDEHIIITLDTESKS